MPEPPPNQSPEEPPRWALDEARGDLPLNADQSEVTALAWRLVESAAEQLAETHDEYDDPDQGGEA
jgi:hypothetical protein